MDILRGSPANRIRFHFDSGGSTHTISRRTFLRVANAIDRRTVSVTVSTTFDPGVGALYHSSTNNIETPPVIGRVNEGLVMHECTHAAFDLTKTAVAAVDDEAASYVVDAMYFRMTGLARPRWNAGLHGLAGNIADGILRAYQAGREPVPTADSVNWNLLRAFLFTHPIYVSGPVGGGGSYLHNG